MRRRLDTGHADLNGASTREPLWSKNRPEIVRHRLLLFEEIRKLAVRNLNFPTDR